MGCSPWSQRHAGVHQRERGVQPPPLEAASLRLKPYTRRAARISVFCGRLIAVEWVHLKYKLKTNN